MDPAIFLDIGGVLQPGTNERRFKQDLVKLKDGLVARDPIYSLWNKYALGAVQYDWSVSAVECLATLCSESQGRIVIISDWRHTRNEEGRPTNRSLAELQAIFCLWGIGHLVVDQIPWINNNRPVEISEYLRLHPEVRQYVILDDDPFRTLVAAFPDRLVTIQGELDEGHVKRALEILRDSRDGKSDGST